MNRSARRGTLASIAAELGVSRTTVSNAYNKPDQLSADLREKILSTATRLGYPGPDPMARSLRTRRAGAIGVMLTEELTYAFEDQASLEFMSGVSKACSKMNASMLLIPAGVEPETNGEHAAELINQASVDGFIVYSVAGDDPFLEAVVRRNLPTVICDQPADELGVDYVGINDKTAIQPVVQKIVDAGHTKVGILCIRLDRTPNNGPVTAERLGKAHMHVQRSRIEGALEVLAEAGIAQADVPIIERHINDATNSRSAAEELLDSHPDLTAVICTVDSMAMAVADAVEQRGGAVPQDVSITGFDGIPQAIARGITTVRQPSQEKGMASGDMLAQAIEDGQIAHTTKSKKRVQSASAQRVLLETSVVDGSSIAAPRAGALPGK